MHKFKVGDLVWFEGNGAHDLDRPEIIWDIDSSGKIQGRYLSGVISVTHVDPKYYSPVEPKRAAKWAKLASKYAPATTQTFSKGDIVEVIDQTDGWGKINKGDIGRVVKPAVSKGGSGYVVDFTNQKGWVGQAHCFRPTSLTFVEPKKVVSKAKRKKSVQRFYISVPAWKKVLLKT